MTVVAVFPDGREVPVASRLGGTLDAVLRSLTADSLTGSAVPLADAEIELQDGSRVPYAELSGLTVVESFL